MTSNRAKRARVRKYINVDIREPIDAEDPRVATLVVHDPDTGKELYRGKGIVSMRARGQKGRDL